MGRKKQTDQNTQYHSDQQDYSGVAWEDFGANQLNTIPTMDTVPLNNDYEAPLGAKVFNTAALAFGLAGGLVGAVLAILLNALVIREMLDPEMNLHLCQILMIGTGAMLTGGGALAGVLLSSAFYPKRLRLNRAAGAIWAIAAAALLVTGCLMQYIYSLGGVAIAVSADDYIFVIDDSGSMSATDPLNARVASMSHMMNRLTEDNRIGMIFFNEGIVYESQMAPMSPLKENEYMLAVNRLCNSGGTDLSNAVTYALNMPGVSEKERLTEIVLLTDGESGWVNTVRLAKLCAQNNVRISAIALSDAINAGVLQKLTRMTGGALYPVEQLDDLIDVYSKVGVVSNVRDLLGLRSGMDHGSFWLGLLRVFSWALIGAIIGCALMLAVRSEPRYMPLVTTGTGAAFGILLELMNLLWLDGSIFSTNWKILLVPLVFIAILFYRKERDYGFDGMQIDWVQASGNSGDANKLNSTQDDHTIYRL